jgi:hypothetical protein
MESALFLWRIWYLASYVRDSVQIPILGSSLGYDGLCKHRQAMCSWAFVSGGSTSESGSTLIQPTTDGKYLENKCV